MACLQVAVDDALLDVHERGEGEPLLLVQTALSVDELVPLGRHAALAAYRVLDLRRRGYAARATEQRDAPSGHVGSAPGSVVLDAEDCAAVLQQLDIARAHVLGTSYSAAVALELASRHPDLVSSLTLVEPPPANVAAGEQFRDANRRLAQVFEQDGVTAALEEFTHVLGTRSWLTERAAADQELVARIEQDAAVFFGRDVPALVGWRFGSVEAGRVTAPVLYVGGADSGSWFQQVHRWVLDLFPQAEHHLLTGAGHTVVSTHTDEVAALVARFLDRVGG
jgi:pimeloyl-ACP methyl ester carboxylesterase